MDQELEQILNEEIEMEESPEILDDDHSALIFQGAIDVAEGQVDGQESYATRYLMGAMAGAGMLGSDFNGSESVWSSVKSGFSKSITYIKNFFMGIWNFFFGKDSVEKDTALEKEVDDRKKELGAAKGELSPEKASSVSTAIVAAAAKVDTSAGTSVAKLKTGVNESKIGSGEMPIKNILQEILDKLHKDIEHCHQQIKAVGAIKNGNDAMKVLTLAGQLWAGTVIFLTKGRVKTTADQTKGKIAELESLLSKSEDAETKEKITKALASLKEVMKMFTEIQHIKTNVKTFLRAIKDKLSPNLFHKIAA